jgi:hypothetical protein
MVLASCLPGGTTVPIQATMQINTAITTVIPSTPTIVPTATSTPRPRIKAGDQLGFLKGMNYVSFFPANYGLPYSDLSLKALADTGTKWVSINVSGLQNDRNSTVIDSRMNEDTSVIHAIQIAHQLDMNVMLKIHADPENDPGAWPGNIGEGFNAAQWTEWFVSYTELVLDYTRLAEENGVEMVCIGTELSLAQMQTKHFKTLIAEVRQVFPGPVTYSADWSAPETEWWDQVDYIGIDAYYQLTKKSSPSLDELESAWQPIVAKLEALAQKWNKPIIFTEMGFNAQEYSACNGGCGRNMERAELGRLDLQTQANVYQSVFNVFRDKEWLQGVFWWVWGDNVYSGGMCDPQYTPKGKLAENVLRTEYGVAPAILIGPAPLPVFDEQKIVEFPVFTDKWGDVNPDGGWNMEVSTVSAPVFKGSQAIKIEMKSNGGFSAFLPPLDTSPYQWLELYIYSETDIETNGIYFSMADKNWQDPYFNDLTHCNYLDNQSTLLAGQWNRILIPLREIDAYQQIRNSVSFANSSQKELVFWVDEMRFVGLK